MVTGQSKEGWTTPTCPLSLSPTCSPVAVWSGINNSCIPTPGWLSSPTDSGKDLAGRVKRWPVLEGGHSSCRQAQAPAFRVTAGPSRALPGLLRPPGPSQASRAQQGPLGPPGPSRTFSGFPGPISPTWPNQDFSGLPGPLRPPEPFKALLGSPRPTGAPSHPTGPLGPLRPKRTSRVLPGLPGPRRPPWA